MKKELPEPTQIFGGIDKQFRSVLGGIHRTKNAVAATDSDDLLPQLEKMAGELEVCEKALADFLESKKRIFPRFYFLATTYLLDILSNGNRPWVVAGHINNMLQGVKKLELTGEPAITLTELVSNEGEVLKLAKKGPLKLQGKVEIYLGTLITHVRNELCAQMGAAITDYNSRERKDWLFDHLGQICIVTTMYAWTRDTEKAFESMGLGDRDALKDYRKKQLSMMSDLITLVQGEMESLQRRKVMNLITMETHARDINKEMIEEVCGFSPLPCFTPHAHTHANAPRPASHPPSRL